MKMMKTDFLSRLLKGGLAMVCALGMSSLGIAADTSASFSEESNEANSYNPAFLRVDSDGSLSFAGGGGWLTLAKEDIDAFRALVKKIDEWAQIAKENKLEDIRKKIGSIGKHDAEIWIFSIRPDDGTLAWQLRIQEQLFGPKELHGFIRILDRLPELEAKIKKADELLK